MVRPFPPILNETYPTSPDAGIRNAGGSNGLEQPKTNNQEQAASASKVNNPFLLFLIFLFSF